MWNKLCLKWKIFTFLLGFCSLFLILLWLFQTVFLNDMYKMIRRHEIDEAVALVEQNIDSSNLQSVISQMEEEKEIFILPENEFARPEKAAPEGNPEGNHEGNLRGWNKPIPETLTCVKQFMLKDGREVAFTFRAMITPVNATISTLQMQLSIITAIMIMVSVVLALLIAARIARPIVRLNDSAKQLADGNYDTRFSGKGFLEITELSNTLNYTAGELSKAEGFRRELMANISHDLRTPLSLIYSYAEMMHDFPEEIVPEQTQTIMNETKRLTSLVNDVLAVSQLETGTMELNLQTYNLTDSIRKTVNRMAELLKKDGYELSFDFKEEVMTEADEVKITQAFYNLLLNAVNYSGKDQRVVVRQKVSCGYVKIEITDKGEGIAPESLPYIWDRYYKVDKKHKRAVTGTGLGLSIVKKILDLHGAECGVDSKMGNGSTFWIKLKTVI